MNAPLHSRKQPGRVAREPRIYGPKQHGVRSDQLTSAARTVVRKLQDEGFKAFIVGGAVRDLLLGRAPKDFDIATNATPEQVKPLFRRAFIVGRRFRLVHVHLGNVVLEVSTFLAAQTGDDASDEH
jgi:poly(A) polymerase